MNKRNNLVARHAQTLFSTVFILFLISAEVLAQDGRPKTDVIVPGRPMLPAVSDPKAEQIIERARKALGGDAYMNIRSTTSRGYYTLFKDGASGLPLTFVDYIIYPDRERTEFKGAGVKVIQTNTGDTGWLYDGEAKTLNDMTKEQVDDFRFAMRTNIDYLLRDFWRKEGAKLSYAGRREAGLAKRNETVRLTYPDGLAVEFEFGAQDGLPSKVLYKKKNKEGAETAEEDRFAQYVTIEGVMMPFIVDHYRDGVQSSRINYQSVEINRPISESLFTRPANAKAVK
ncbi:MAG TPA: hypothetical protein VEQ40_07145 [Pyrinomonadaceae bacterium]|nr:hypothetical protein [Pyrinomonadaceae bacterium]